MGLAPGFLYKAFGLSVACDMSLQLAPFHEQENLNPDLIIIAAATAKPAKELSAQPAETPGGIRHDLQSDGSLCIGWDRWFDLHVSRDGRTVEYSVLDPTAGSFLEPYLINFAISAALLMRGEEPLHGTALSMHGRTFALLGDSGMGKSTLAASLVAEGAQLITDDLLRLEPAGAHYMLHHGPERLKLRTDSASSCLPEFSADGMWNPVSGKMIYALNEPGSKSGSSSRQAVQLDGIFNLRPDDGRLPTVRAEEMFGAGKFSALSAATMNALLETPERLQRQFAFCEALARAVPVHDLFYPREYGALAATREEILRVLT